jgi:hypothetical protein
MILPLVIRHPGRAKPIAKRGFAGTRFADQPHDLAAPQGDVHALDDFMPAIVTVTVDDDVLHFQQKIAFLPAFFGIHAVGLNPSARWTCAGTSRPRS